MNKIFLDANILVDYTSVAREGNGYATALLSYCLFKNIQLYTSCDIITTIYYITAKGNKKFALEQIENINRFCTIVEFANKEVADACELMSQNSAFCDLEDTLQYVLAKKAGCEVIISNDRDFFSPNVQLLSAREFCEKYLDNH